MTVNEFRPLGGRMEIIKLKETTETSALDYLIVKCAKDTRNTNDACEDSNILRKCWSCVPSPVPIAALSPLPLPKTLRCAPSQNDGAQPLLSAEARKNTTRQGKTQLNLTTAVGCVPPLKIFGCFYLASFSTARSPYPGQPLLIL